MTNNYDKQVKTIGKIVKKVDKATAKSTYNKTLNTSGTASIPSHDTKVNSAFHPF